MSQAALLPAHSTRAWASPVMQNAAAVESREQRKPARHTLSLSSAAHNPTRGKIYIKNREIGSLSRKELTIFRRRNIGFVFQNYNLLPLLNVYENVVLPIQLDGIRPDKDYVNHILDMLGLSEKRYAMPGQLSGGQQQRTALARALAAKPAIVQADEPTGNLDTRTGQDVLGLLKIRLEDGRICGGGIYD